VGLDWLEKADINVAPNSMELQTGLFAKSMRLNPSTLKNS
jgi:hypothetical protein